MQTQNLSSPDLSQLKQNQPEPNHSSYKFKTIKYLKLYDLYKSVKNTELKNQNESMFPPNFSQTHQKQLQTYLFEVQVQDTYKKWRIIKRFPDLIDLKQKLHKKFADSPLIFSFPETEESQIDQIYAFSILELFSTFLTSISKSQEIMKQKQCLLFLENWVSPENKKIVTFYQKNLMKKAGGRHTESSLTRIMNNFISWRHKFFTITNQGVYYTDEEDSFNVKEMILFNQSFGILHGQVKTGYTFGLILNSSHRILQIDAETVFNFLLFIFYIRKVIDQKEESMIHRFNSFAKVRSQCCQSAFYIDGKDYFKGIYNELKKAKSQVFITGWIVTPHMYLVQNFQDLEHRIDKVLQKLALQGVKVYIIVYNAPRIAIDINPQFTESYLTSLHPNIKVLRHPHYYFIPFLWSHHQKMVIVDQKVAFMGGLDIGYGRMDDCRHLISDEKEETWKGIEYCNYRIKDLEEITKHEVCSIDRLTQPRMPWHDVGIRLTGPSVIDLCKHFIQYWNYANHQLYLTERELLMFTGIHEEELASISEIEQNFPLEKTQNLNQNLTSQDLKPESFNKNKNTKLDSLIQTKRIQKHPSSKNKTKLQRSPETSKFISFVEKGSSKMYDDSPELKKLRSSQFLQINIEHPKESERHYYLNYIKSNIEKSSVFNIDMSQQFFIDKISQQKPVQSLVFNEENRISETQTKTVSSNQGVKFKQTHQILRSASLWSLGIEQGKQQKSILEAYLALIQNSKHFIYIQNQFFMSVQNQVSHKIVERIFKAVENKENFKVVIMIPFLPGFSGEVEDQNAAVFRVQLDLIYKTICRGEQSMLEQLSGIGNLEDYLAIYCLRTHGLISGLPATEIVYIHSKVMIVDDSVALIGSANINDRSLMGDRDSEIAIIVEDSEQIQISNQSLGLPILKVKRFAHELRKSLYMEHFALSSDEAEHFLDFNVWDKMMFNAERNQKIYRKIFGCYPDDGIKSFSGIKQFREEAEPERYDELKILIKGFACPFQKEFLCNQSLQLHSGQKEYYIPFINFT